MSNLCGSLRCDVVIWLEAKRLGRGEGVAEKFVSLTKSQPAGTAQTSAALVASHRYNDQLVSLGLGDIRIQNAPWLVKSFVDI